MIDGSAEYAAEALDASIERMQGITPDAWIVHRIDKSVCACPGLGGVRQGTVLTSSERSPIEETVLAMEKARKEGKTKYIGLSEVSLR